MIREVFDIETAKQVLRKLGITEDCVDTERITAAAVALVKNRTDLAAEVIGTCSVNFLEKMLANMRGRAIEISGAYDREGKVRPRTRIALAPLQGIVTTYQVLRPGRYWLTTPPFRILFNGSYLRSNIGDTVFAGEYLVGDTFTLLLK